MKIKQLTFFISQQNKYELTLNNNNRNETLPNTNDYKYISFSSYSLTKKYDTMI